MAMLCVHRESSAPTLPIQQFYIGSEDSYGIVGDLHNSTILPVHQTKHISISSDEPVESSLIDYCKQKPILYSQLAVADRHLQSPYVQEMAGFPAETPSRLSSTNSDHQFNQPSRTTDSPVENLKPSSEPTGNIQSNIPDKGGYEINEDFLREPAPNGGWGWLVALGSFLCIFTVDGVCFTYGLHINEMIHEGQFRLDPSNPNKSQRETSLALLSLPGALLCGMYFLFGPLTGALVNRFGYRIVASIGAVITSLCFLISALYIYDLVTFTIVFGIIGGIGCSLVYLPAITVVGHWFEEHRAFIVGIVMCGGCLGAGLMAIITPYLAHHFSWRGSLILLSGLLGQTLVGIALFRPVSVHEKIKAIRLLKQMEKKQLKPKKCKFNCLLSSHKSKQNSIRKIAIQRGSIMARIIEEKSRQRTTSTGSLDGMVITRENQLVALSSDAYEVVKAAAAIYSANTSNMVSINAQEKEQSEIQTTYEENQISSSESTSFEQLRPSSSMNVKSNSLKYSLDNNRKNLQTLTEGFPMSSFDHTTEKFHANAQPPCIAVLPPPVQFSRAAVRRIARAILRKLHGQSKLPFSPSITSISIGSRQVIPPSFRSSGENRIDTCSTFSTPYTNSSRNIQYDRVNHVYRYELFHGSVATNIWRRKRSLFASSLYNELPSNTRDSVASTGPIRHISTAVNRSISSQESHIQLKLPTPDSPSALTSLISLDSYTGHIISHELNSLLLDQSTKLAILNDIRRELSRPKYRPDFFYAGNKRKLPLYHVPEYTTCKQLPCDANYGLKELTIHSPNSNVVNQCPNLLKTVIPIENVILLRNKSLIPDNQKIDVLINTSKENKNISQLRKLIALPKIDELFSYLADMLDSQILKSFTFIILSIACFVNMLVFLVPFHYLPLLLDFGGIECYFNSLWCPNELPAEIKHNLTYNQFDQSTIKYINVLKKNYAFSSPESLFLTIGFASIFGRLFAGFYIEKGLNTNRKFLRQCPLMVDPMLLNNVALIVCGFSIISFPLAIHGIMLTKNSDQSSTQRLQAWSLKFRSHLLYIGSIVYGLTNTISISLRSVILVELFGIRRLTNAFGYLLIFQGLGVICGPPLFGLFSDQACHRCLDNPPFCESIPTEFTSTGHKECTMRLVLSFYICAGLFILSSVLFMPLRWLAKHDPYRNAYTIQSSIIISGNTPQLDEEISFSVGLGQGEVYDPQETQTTHVLYDENESNVKTN